MPFYKSKKFYIITGIVVLVVGLIVYGQIKKANAPIVYDTAKVIRGNITQTVEATGEIQSSDGLSLRLETAGTVGEVKVKENDAVKAGDILIRLKSAELDAAVAQASANLQQKLAGATSDDISYYRSAVDIAKAALDQAKADGGYSVSNAELAVETAKNNLKMAEGGESSQIVIDAYDDAIASLSLSLSTMDNSITQADNILGIDNTLANDDYEDNLSSSDGTKLNYANNVYPVSKDAVAQARTKILPLTTASTHNDVDAALISAETALNKCVQLLVAVKDVLTATPPVGTLTQTTLDAKKTMIETTRLSAATYYSNTVAQKQAIRAAQTSYTTYTIAYNKAVKDLENARLSATSMIAIKEASYSQALSNLNSKTTPPREVDVASLRAALSQAVANRDKAVLKAPIDGVVSKVNKKRGEYVSMSDVVVEMLTPHYEVSVDIPETDVVKTKVGDAVVITLDAYGDDIKFGGKVINIDPDSTEVEDVVYYRVKVALDETDKEIKPGMTANVTVSTASRENVLYIPIRALRTNDSGKYVRVLKNNSPVDTSITIGLKADNGQVEIISGLSENDEVIVSTVQ
ncbi:MAG: efflux RND transporter periplasmic adaptor subunit [Patescibacteria group bacterium]